MRLATALLACTVSTCVLAMADESSSPRRVYIAHDRTPVRSGPGDDHYRTDQLAKGTAVEVYPPSRGGWLAIRPPESSFSWVAQRDVELSDQGSIAKVVGTSAVSWIGSSVEDVADHRWLVKLKEGESLEVLGRQRRRVVSDGRSDLYYKVSPPSGEFRWVHQDDVVESPEKLPKKKDSSVMLADFRVALHERQTEKQASGEFPVAAAAAELAEESATDAKKDDFIGRHSAGKLSPPPARISRIENRESPSKAGSTSTSTSRSTSKSEPLVLDPRAVDSRLRELDGALSLLVSQPVETWNFGELRRQAQEILEDSTSTLDRARVQVFLDKVSDFEGLRSKHAVFSPAVSELARNEKKRSARQDSQSDSDSMTPRFDGVGWLLPVHSSKRNAPPYALLDEDGNILQFVSPAPGLNLNRYLRKEVGIFGQRQAATTLDKPHLTAHRIVERDRHRD